MLRISNIRIGIKLAIMSGLGVLLVVGMIATSMYNNSLIKQSNATAKLQQSIVRDLGKIESAFTSVRLSMRNIRLAENAADLQAANNLEVRQKAIDSLIEPLLTKLRVPANRDRLAKVQGYIKEYIGNTLKEIVPLKAEALGVDAKDGTRIAALEEKMSKIQKEHLDPDVAKAISLIDEITQIATELSAREDENAEEEMATSERVDLTIGVTVILILIGSAFFGTVTIAKPLRALVRPLDEIAGGNFLIKVPGVDRKDEVGQIASAVGQMADKVRTTIAEIKASGREVTNASAEISTSTTDLSQRTEEQAASLEETSASMEELTSTVKKNAENAQQANQFSAETRTVAERGGEVVARAVDAMARIEDSSRKISDIIGVIDEIARQTNLLALNAAVEAARAGEAGRGFAVVASEVRSLAQRSSQAAKDIKDLITNSSGQVKDGVDLVNKAGELLTEIVASIKKVATIVADIANASIEQSSGIEQINRALTQMDEVTQQNSALVEENAATAKTLEQQAKVMDERVAFFRVDDGAAEWLSDKAPAKRAASERGASAPVQRAAAPKPNGSAAGRARTAAVSAARRGPVGRMQTALATAIQADSEWKEF